MRTPRLVPDGEEDVVYLVEDGVDGPRRHVVREYPVAQQRTLDEPGQTNSIPATKKLILTKLGPFSEKTQNYCCPLSWLMINL